MQSLGIAHLADYVDCERPDRLEYRGGQYVAVARDHAHLSLIHIYTSI